MAPRTLLFCNTPSAKRSFLPFEPSHLGTKNQSTTQTFFHTFFIPPPFCFLICFKNGRFGTTFEIQWAPKIVSQIDPWRKQKVKNISVRLIVAGPGSCIYPESIPIDFWRDFRRLLIDLDRWLVHFLVICYRIVDGFVIVWNTFLGTMFANVFLEPTNKKQGLTRSAKIC